MAAGNMVWSALANDYVIAAETRRAAQCCSRLRAERDEAIELLALISPVTLRYARRASARLDAILSHVASPSPSGAANLLKRIEDVEDLLRLFPLSGCMTTIPGIRRVPVVPYPDVLDDRCIGPDVVVQRIRHTSRRSIGR